MSACQCPKCEQEFSGITYFDAHQDVDYKRKPAVVCRPPQSVGLVQDSRGIWTTPQGAAGLTDRRRRFAAIRGRRAT